MEAGIFTPSDNERRIFSKLNGLTLKSTIYSSAPQKEGFTFPEEMWMGPMNNFDGRLRGLRNSSIAIHGHQMEVRPRAVAYQADRRPPDAVRNQELRGILVDDLVLTGLEEVQLEYEKNVRVLCAALNTLAHNKEARACAQSSRLVQHAHVHKNDFSHSCCTLF